MKFSIRDFLNKCDQTADLVTFTEQILKGGLSGRDDLTVLNCFRVKKSKLSNFRFHLIFIFNKKEPQSSSFATYWRKALFEFLTSQKGKMVFYNFQCHH